MESTNTALVATILSSHWLLPIIIWSLIWKLLALWQAARRNHLTMFIVIAVVNTVGILEIGYLIYLWRYDKKHGK